MKNILKFVKKYSTLLLLIMFVLLITVFVILAGIFIPKTEGNVYGNRLADIDKHKISEELKKDVKTAITETEKTTSSTFDIVGKIIKIDIKVKDDVSMEDAKKIYDVFKGKISEDIMAYYDLTIILEGKDYTSFGYLKAGKTDLKWTNNKE